MSFATFVAATAAALGKARAVSRAIPPDLVLGALEVLTVGTVFTLEHSRLGRTALALAVALSLAAGYRLRALLDSAGPIAGK
jgi:hypothetical protein